MATAFNLKEWLDRNVIPLLAPELALHFFLADHPPSASAPSTVLIWALAKAPEGWAPAVKRLLERPGFSFDFLRAPQIVAISPERSITLFGGDGAPFIGKNGMAMARLYQRGEDGTDLVLEVGHPYPTAQAAAAAVKSFFTLFDGTDPLELLAHHRPIFGTA